MYEFYACPVCHAPLRLIAQCLRCALCAEEFSLEGGIPQLIPARAYQLFPAWQVADIYDRVYQHPEIMGTKLDPEYSRVTKTTLLEFCRAAPNPRYLDIGTGDGDLWQFASADGNAYGIDISLVGICRALQRFPRLNAAAAVSEWLPYPDGYFGAVIAADTIEHAFDLLQTLREVRRVLSSGGVFALSVPTPNSLRRWGYNQIARGVPSLRLIGRLLGNVARRTLLFGRPTFQPIDRDIPIEGWQALIEQAGFQIVNRQEWPSAPLKPMVYLLSAHVVP